MQELDHEYVQVFYAAAIDLPDVSFAVTQSNEVISKYGLTHDAVLLLKKVLYMQLIFNTHIQVNKDVQLQNPINEILY